MSVSDPHASQRGTLLDRAAIAARAGISDRMARRLISERRVPTVKIGRHVRVWSADLDAYLARNTRPAEDGAR